MCRLIELYSDNRDQHALRTVTLCLLLSLWLDQCSWALPLVSRYCFCQNRSGLFICVAAGQASQEEDRERILTEIGDKSQLLDDRVHGMIASAALQRVYHEGNHNMSRYLEALRRSTPTKLRLDLTAPG